MKIYFIFMILMSGLLKGSAKFWFINNGDLAVTDMSKICVNNLQQNIFLPYSMGIADAIAITITNKYGVRNCSFVFHEDVFDNQTVRIIVIELLNKPNVTHSQSTCEGINLYLTDSSSNTNDTINVCQRLAENNLNPFVHITTFMVRFVIEDSNNTRFQSVKITASSSKKIETNEICNANSEIKCVFNKNYTCISRELQCDQNINCGQYNLYDEDQYLCKKNKNEKLWLTILVGTILSLFVLYSIAHRIQRCFPLCKIYFMSRNKKEENTIVLTTQYLPAAKTYIPMKEVEEISRGQTSSEIIKPPDNSDVIQSHLLNLYNQRQKRKLYSKNPGKTNLKDRYLNI